MTNHRIGQLFKRYVKQNMTHIDVSSIIIWIKIKIKKQIEKKP